MSLDSKPKKPCEHPFGDPSYIERKSQGSMSKQYAKRNPMKLDEAGGYYIRHVSAMTGEKLHAKSEIAGELGYRDMVIDELRKQNEVLKRDYESMKALYETDLENRDKTVSELLEALERISAYPTTRADELSAEKMRSIAKQAISKAKGE